MFPKIFLGIVIIVTGMSAIAAETALADFEVSPEEHEIINLTNKEREKAGLPALKVNPTLMKLAREHSAAMAKAEKLAHTLNGKTLVQRLKEIGFKPLAAGENVAWNESTPGALVNAWMHSLGHRANVLNKYYTDIGVGAARDSTGHPYYTQDFARPVQAGATAVAQFSISNETSQSASVSIPDQPTQAELEPGETTTIYIGGVGQLPKVKITVGKESQELSAQDRADYVIEQDKEHIKVTPDKESPIPVSNESEPAR